MVSWLGARGARVIEIDTDGIYFRPPDGVRVEDLQKGLAAELPPGIEVEFDKRYPAMFSYKAKNYALLDDSGALVIKGAALKSRGMEPYLRDYLEDVPSPPARGRTGEGCCLARGTHAEDSPPGNAHWRLGEDRGVAGLRLPPTRRKLPPPPETGLRRSSSRSKADETIRREIRSATTSQARPRRSPLTRSPRLVSEWNPEARDENVEYYVSKLDELATKFEEFASKRPVQADLFAS